MPCNKRRSFQFFSFQNSELGVESDKLYVTAIEFGHDVQRMALSAKRHLLVTSSTIAFKLLREVARIAMRSLMSPEDSKIISQSPRVPERYMSIVRQNFEKSILRCDRRPVVDLKELFFTSSPFEKKQGSNYPHCSSIPAPMAIFQTFRLS